MTGLQRLIEAVEGGASAAVIDFYTPLDWADGSGDLGLVARSAFNGSLDAAKALHEALLGAERYGYGIGPWGARVWIYSSLPDWDRSVRQEVDLVNNPARAWLIAILKAYEAQQ